MKLSFVICSAFLLFLQVRAQTRNYCAPTLCPPNVFHVACTSSNTFAPTCPKDARILASSDIQEHQLSEINRLRNEIALGDVETLAPAMRMATVQWDTELARLAEVRVRRCRGGTDPCRNVDRWNAVSQLVYSALKPANYIVAAFITEAFEFWFAGGFFITPDIVAEYLPDTSYEEFAQLVVDKVTRMGCRLVDCTQGNLKNVTMACNLNSSPIIGQPVYNAGCALAQCFSGRNRLNTGLCSINEIIDPNPVI